MKKRIKRKFDPRLKAAMREVLEILTRYDIGGQIALVSPSHSEFLTHYPTWSMTQYELNAKGKPIGVRFNTRRFEFATEEGKHKAIEASVHLLYSLHRIASDQCEISEGILRSLEESYDITQDDLPPFPHDQAGERAATDPRNRAGWKPWY